MSTPNEALEAAATTLDDLALTLVTTSDDNPEGNTLTAAVLQKAAEIVRQHRTPAPPAREPDPRRAGTEGVSQ